MLIIQFTVFYAIAVLPTPCRCNCAATAAFEASSVVLDNLFGFNIFVSFFFSVSFCCRIAHVNVSVIVMVRTIEKFTHAFGIFIGIAM